MPEQPTEPTTSSESSAAAEFTRALLALERRFWKGDAAFYERHLSADAVMALPVAAGILRRDQIVSSVAAAPRWTQLRIVNPRVVRLSDTSAMLTYRAQASRDGDPAPYLAVASSAYVLAGGEWQLAFHQQTPEPRPPAKSNASRRRPRYQRPPGARSQLAHARSARWRSARLPLAPSPSARCGLEKFTFTNSSSTS